MKRIQILITALLISIAGVQSCSKEKQEEIAYNIAISYLNKGKWKAAKFEENGKNETALFESYVFQFNSNGSVTAANGNIIEKGSWTTYPSGSKTKMNISFSSAPFNRLNKDWVIKSGSASSIQLEHTNSGEGSTDYLYFDKI
jgi:hypothetical protein